MPVRRAPRARSRPPPAVDVTPHAGTYERTSFRLDVLTDDGDPKLRITQTGPMAALAPEPTQTHTLVPVTEDGDLFCISEPGVQTWVPVTFYALPTGERYIHVGGRATPYVQP